MSDKTHYKRINFTLPVDLADWFRVYSKTTEKPMSNIICEFLNKIKTRTEILEALNGEVKDGVVAKGMHEGTERDGNRQGERDN